MLPLQLYEEQREKVRKQAKSLAYVSVPLLHYPQLLETIPGWGHSACLLKEDHPAVLHALWEALLSFAPVLEWSPIRV
jgi:hypothetical protein